MFRFYPIYIKAKDSKIYFKDERVAEDVLHWSALDYAERREMILEVSRSDGYISDAYKTYSHTSKADFMEVIHGKVRKMQDELENGRVSEEAAILTGGQYFSDREWDELIRGYDRALDKFRELMRERHESLKANSEIQKA